MTSKRSILLLLTILVFSYHVHAQCATPITSFPYREGFETTNGGWVPAGTGSDWAWGTPAKTVINTAGGGTRCWIVGGLTPGSYTNGEASWLESPCFDFTSVPNPYIEFKVFWEMEQQFDGASLQYSVDNGASWNLVGATTDASNCLNGNWYNNGSITYLSPLTANRSGWSGNMQPTTGSCRGGNGSNGWVVAKHTMPYLGGTSNVIFRFIFGAGTICNNYDGFAIDDILISEAPPNDARFTYACTSATTVTFTNTSPLCPQTYRWDFGDPASGANNTSSAPNPSHTFSAPGKYTVSLTVSGPGNAPSTKTEEINIISLSTTVLTQADCQTNSGGSASVLVTGGSAPYNFSWNSSPPQTGSTATNLGAGPFTVTVSAPKTCTASAGVTIPLDFSCIGIYFPTGFTPNNDRLNNGFGPLGSLAALKNYQLSVYNRWGERVFYSTDPFKKWDGRVKGFTTDGNVFVWYAEFSLDGQPRQTRKGTVVLIR